MLEEKIEEQIIEEPVLIESIEEDEDKLVLTLRSEDENIPIPFHAIVSDEKLKIIAKAFQNKKVRIIRDNNYQIYDIKDYYKEADNYEVTKIDLKEDKKEAQSFAKSHQQKKYEKSYESKNTVVDKDNNNFGQKYKKIEYEPTTPAEREIRKFCIEQAAKIFIELSDEGFSPSEFNWKDFRKLGSNIVNIAREFENYIMYKVKK